MFKKEKQILYNCSQAQIVYGFSVADVLCLFISSYIVLKKTIVPMTFYYFSFLHAAGI